MQGNFFRSIVAIFLGLYIGASFATSIPNTSSNPKTFLGPTVRLGVTKPIDDTSAFSLAGELGFKNLRIGGTLAWQIDYHQRIKATVELLKQKLTYSFFDGRQDEWLNQGAVGANYQYFFQESSPFNTAFDLSAYYSRAPSRGLGTTTGNFVDSAGVTQDYTLNKRIAGSNAAGISPGVSLDVTETTRAGLALNYDNVRYDRVYRANSVDAKGFGGTAFVKQNIIHDMSLGLSAAVRQPFNNYQADLSWDNVSYHGIWILKFFGAYTIGKNTLPTSYNVGLSADYLMDAAEKSQPIVKPAPLPTYKDTYKDFVPPVEWDESVNTAFLAWSAAPAVYLPEVLAVPDERVQITPRLTPTPPIPPIIPPTPVCDPPAFTGTISDTVAINGVPFTLDVSSFFSGSDPVFSATGLPTGLSIDPSTGVISGTPAGGHGEPFEVTVTVTNDCGSASSNTFTITTSD